MKRVIRDFLRDRNVEHQARSLADLPEPCRREAARRRIIIDLWRRAIFGGAILGFDADQVTAQYLVALATEDVHLCRSTLFNWGRRFDAGGVAGLVDGRTVRRLTAMDN